MGNETTLLIFDLAVKSTLITALGLAGLVCIRRASAALRHRLLSTLLWCLMLVPMIAPLLPRWYLPEPTVTAPIETVALPSSEPRSERTRLVAPLEVAPAEHGWSLPAPSLTTLWLMGTGLVGLWFLAGHIRAARLVRGAEALEETRWQDVLRTVSDQAGLRRRIGLRCSDEVDSPVVIGMLSPVVLIPRAARSWPLGRIRAVLRHELAHLARHDLLHQTIAQLVCALYWFNPLVWVVGRQLAITREAAADDFVIRGGMRPSDYAVHLLAAAGHSLHQKKPLEVLAMAKKPSLKSRLTAILDPAVRREPARGLTTHLTVMLVAALALPVAAFAPFDEPPQPPEAPVPVIAPSPALPAAIAEPPALADVPAPPHLAPAPESVPEPGQPALAPAPEALDAPMIAPALPAPVAEPAPVARPLPAPTPLPRPALAPLPDHDDEEEEALEEALEAFEEEIERLIERFEDRMETRLERLEEVLDNWEDDVEDRYEDRMSEAEEEAFEDLVESLEDKMDALEERFEDELDSLEDQFEPEEDIFNPELQETWLHDLRELLDEVGNRLDDEVEILERELRRQMKKKPF